MESSSEMKICPDIASNETQLNYTIIGSRDMDRMEQCFHIFESSPPTEKYDAQKKRISDIIVELERAYHFDAWHTIVR
ncbi:hypothetical protein T4E_7392 [Trichinella pseudospiralis]|uniref:Uncharacterized protein n=1 Tax=Trichinella pseudospiralis TaxID=6337 RepID=A0A0V0XUM8_TRIPS|nr:hypothetical protein T4E_7392 [Trichinella pseudospiralis]